MSLLEVLREEKDSRRMGGIYHSTQIKLAYNTNRIEGSKLSEEQTRYIYETNTLFVESGETTANVDDIIETVNHFGAFDYMLNIADEMLTEEHIKRFHYLLKINTSNTKKSWFRIGEYKMKPNIVGNKETTPPEQVEEDIDNLLTSHHQKKSTNIEDIIDFHYHFEKIHPFQDGNGRVGRLIMYKECLSNNIVPFIIEDEFKFYYYRGLAEYTHSKGYLIETCLAAQDVYKKMIDYFKLQY